MKKKTWRLSLREEYYGMAEVDIINLVSIELNGKPIKLHSKEYRKLKEKHISKANNLERYGMEVLSKSKCSK